jgi:uncharacterized protein YodC (DUF2158 family)
MNFNVGDVVMVKSGGPKMTVDQVARDEVRCVWFDERAGDFKRAVFPVATLEKF